jgi:phosphoglycolate phosphatase-like HAD superfamily hydrolase
MLSAMIFDLDGTLVDTNAAHVEAWVRACARHGYKVHADRIGPEIGKGGDNLVPDVLGKEAEERDGEALREACKEEYLALAKQRRFRIFDGAGALLDELRRRGIRTALATSSGSEHLDATFAARARTCGRAWTWWSARATSSTPSVPRRRAGRGREARLSPAECAMVGDTPYDALSARRAGVLTLGVLSSGSASTSGAGVAGARHLRDVGHLGRSWTTRCARRRRGSAADAAVREG